MKSNGKRKLNLKNISGVLNSKVVYRETGKIIANPLLKDESSYYEDKTK